MLEAMDAVRCLRCGDTRWTFRPESLERLLSEPCEACGGPVVLERRRPGSGRSRPRVERRHADRRIPPRTLAGR
jgi:hypothetical protein